MGKKRTAAETDGEMESRDRSKAVKVASDTEKPKPKGKRAASPKKAQPKTIVPDSARFKEHALPLHVNITHTPPTVAEPASQADTNPTTSTDPGHVSSITLAPSIFSTGSFGWKGSTRVAVELADAEGQKEMVMVTMSFNATVVGSKPKSKPKRRTRSKKKDDDDDDDEEEDDDDE